MNRALLYSKYSHVTKKDTKHVLQKYLHLIKWNPDGGDCVLDVGCGPGDITKETLQPLLPKTFKKLIGADISHDMVEFAKKHFSDSKLTYKQLDILIDMPAELCNEFDHIFSFYCLHWVQDHRQVLNNFYQLLKPRGDFLIAFLASSLIFQVYERLSSHPKWNKYMKTYKNYISPYQNCEHPEYLYEKLLTEAGFKTLLCEAVEMDHVYPNLDSFRNLVASVNPFIDNMPEHERSEYLNDFIDEVRKLNCMEYDENNQEVVRKPYKLFIVCASKKN